MLALYYQQYNIANYLGGSRNVEDMLTIDELKEFNNIKPIKFKVQKILKPFQYKLYIILIEILKPLKINLKKILKI